MVGLCMRCFFGRQECKGQKDIEKVRCEYFRPFTNLDRLVHAIGDGLISTDIYFSETGGRDTDRVIVAPAIVRLKIDGGWCAKERSK